ncbi:holin [Oceanobacillus profundus]|uniref:holin n=1 Tax=Oceanobacillus TaxID=182709 RepID=UPI0026E22399|nr:holin [Oceanobacillus profundus]MDO6448073.1 holin [Oceanobacillus profundus]
MEQVLIFATVLLPIVTALVEGIKKSISMPVNVIPIISLIIGLAIGSAAYPFTEMDLVLRLWAGGFAGLAGTGLFELVKQREGTTK